MEKNLYAIGRRLLYSALLCGAAVLLPPAEERTLPPLPTDRAPGHEEDDSKRSARNAWIEQMHRAAPGTDWRLLDQQTRIRKAEERFRELRSIPRWNATDFSKVSIGGQVTGHWREVGSSNQAGRIHLTAYDTVSSTLYAASASGNIWSGNLGGTAWEVKNDLFAFANLHALEVIPLPGGGRRLLAAYGAWGQEGMRYSDDGGTTWNTSSGLSAISAFGWGAVHQMIVAADPLQSIYLLVTEWDGVNWGSRTALYRSTDHGLSFSLTAGFPESAHGPSDRFDVWADESQLGPVFFLENDQFYSLDASGQPQWVSTLPFAASGRLHLKGRASGGSLRLYIARDNYNGSTDIFQSPDGGLTWSATGTAPSGMFTANSFYVSRSNADQLFIGGINAYRSPDGGLTWTLVNEWWEYYGNISGKLHADIPAFNSFRDGTGQEVFVISTDGGCYVSSDALQTVSNISLEGLHVSQYYSILTNRSNFAVLYAGSQDQGYQRSQNDNGLIMGFEQLLSGDYGHLSSGDGGNSLWHNYPGFTTYYPDASATANYGIDFNAVGMSCNLWMPPMAADPADPALAWLGGGSGNGCSEAYLYRLEFDGNGITASTDYFDFNNGGGSGAISAVAISESDPDYRYVLTTNQSCFYSTDGGGSWNAGAGGMPGNHYFYGNAILVSPQDPATLYVGGSGYSGPAVFKSTDNGQSFTPMGNGLPATMVYALDGTLDGSMLFAATEVGPYIYFAASNQWYALDGLAAPDQVYWDVEFVPELNAARFATYGRGIWDFVICDVNSPEPLADFSYALDPLNQELSIFNGSSKAYFYEWDFGDGSTSEEAEPVHSYASPGTYPVRLVASTHCSMDTIVQWVSVGTPFPVELLAFEATGLQSSIRLRWEVAQEQGLAFYEVEKQDGNGDFQPLLRVPAAGRSLYQANDDSPRAGLNTYRLRIQEQDGSTRYSSRAEVRWGEAAPRLALTAYPNPILAGQPLQLKIEALAAGNALIALRSGDGKRVAERNAELKAGAQEIRWELPDLSPGVYVVLLRMGGGSAACKLEIR